MRKIKVYKNQGEGLFHARIEVWDGRDKSFTFYSKVFHSEKERGWWLHDKLWQLNFMDQVPVNEPVPLQEAA